MSRRPIASTAVRRSQRIRRPEFHRNAESSRANWIHLFLCVQKTLAAKTPIETCWNLLLDSQCTKSVQDEKIIGPLTDQFGSLFLPSSSPGWDLFKDELAQPHRVESKKVSRVQTVRREWKERSEAAEVESLEQDLMQLRRFISEFQSKLELLKKSRHNRAATTSKEAIETFSSS